jgi:peroxiredoxin/dTDP-4-amino-4,6-dideoxygalactose transaminase
VSRGLLSVWAAPRPRDLLRRRAASLSFPFCEPGCRYYEWGRYALWQGLAASDLEAGDEVLVPAYHHGSEVAVLENRGLVPRFYEATESLEPDPEELERLLGPRTRALYLIHNLGRGLDAPRWRRWCDERGLLLIEDVAMALLAEHGGEPLGSWGDISFFSLWKTHGLPDGGAVLCRGAAPDASPPRREVPWDRLLRGFVRHYVQRSHGLSRAWRARTPKPWSAAEEFSLPAPDNGAAAISLWMLRRARMTDVAAARRRNHARMVEQLRPHVAPPFAEMPPGSCPFGVPVTVADPRALIRHLLEREVSATLFWSVPHPLLPVAEFPAAKRRRETTVLLPVHQELGDSDVDRIAAAVLEFVARGDTDVKPAEKAPDFELLDKDRQPVSLSSLAGQRVVLYFYPEAETPGCTAQACGIRDHQAEIASRGAVTIGISPDSPEKLSSFAERHGLPFKLLSDPGGEVARSYGAWVRRKRPPFRAETLRSTFVIDPEGRIEQVFEAVDPATHDQLVLDALG